LNIEPRFEEFAGEDPLLGCLSLNIARRHLEKGQLAVLAHEMRTTRMQAQTTAEVLAETLPTGCDNNVRILPASSEPQGTPQDEAVERRGRFRSHLAKVLNVSEGYIQMAKNLKEMAPDLYAQVGEGKLNLSEAARKVRKRNREEGTIGADSKEPSDRTRLKGMVVRVCDLLFSLGQDSKEAYDAIQPILSWADEHELRQRALEKLRPDEPEWVAGVQSSFPLPQAA
jgi:hypothetical protein